MRECTYMPTLQEQFGGIDIYLKTTVVQNLRSMTTWMLRRR